MSIEFVPAVCPKCGGELRVPTNLDIFKCMYCGMEIISQDKSKIKVEPTIDVKKCFELAEMARMAGNVAEDDGEDQGGEQGLDHKPNWAEDGLFVIGDKIAPHKEDDEVAIMPHIAQLQIPPIFTGGDDKVPILILLRRICLALCFRLRFSH